MAKKTEAKIITDHIKDKKNVILQPKFKRWQK